MRCVAQLCATIVAVTATSPIPGGDLATNQPTSAVPKLPNLVYILNDDTDVLLGGAASLVQTRKLLGDAGADFTQFRTLSPKCTPSRTGQLAGRHYHNVRPAQKLSSQRPTPPGGGLNQSTMFDADALFPMLHSHGYWTSAVGKIHNGQKEFLCTFVHVSFAARERACVDVETVLPAGLIESSCNWINRLLTLK
jgi:hypothetical protein